MGGGEGHHMLGCGSVIHEGMPMYMCGGGGGGGGGGASYVRVNVSHLYVCVHFFWHVSLHARKQTHLTSVC